MIYFQTFASNQLIAINPLTSISFLYSPDVMKKYVGMNLDDMPPHVYAIGKNNLLSMLINIFASTLIFAYMSVSINVIQNLDFGINK